MQESVQVQACRPEDRAMLQTEAGRELLTAVVKVMREKSEQDCECGGFEVNGVVLHAPKCPKLETRDYVSHLTPESAMGSERNVLRYGSLEDVQELLEERPPANMDEVRAVLMNLLDVARANESVRNRLEDRIQRGY